MKEKLLLAIAEIFTEFTFRMPNAYGLLPADKNHFIVKVPDELLQHSKVVELMRIEPFTVEISKDKNGFRFDFKMKEQ